MKICLTNATLHCGGAERAIIELANYLANEKHEVTILLIFKKDIFYNLNSKVRVLYPDLERNKTNKYWYGIKIIRYIRNMLKVINPDVILNFIFPSFFLLCTIGLEYKIYISIRNNPSKRTFTDPLWLRRLTYKRAKGIIAQTTYAVKTISKQVNHKNIIIIPNFVRKIEKTGEKAQNIIITVCRLVNNKGLEDLLEIFYNTKNNNWKLLIIGDGPLRKFLELKAMTLGIDKKVIFAGFQENVDYFLQQAKIFAFCSYSEGFPNALLEAIATPLPCVSYDCNAGPSDIIEDGVNGFLIPVGNKKMFAAKLQQLMDDENMQQQFVQKAALIATDFKVEKIAKSYYDFISEKN